MPSGHLIANNPDTAKRNCLETLEFSRGPRRALRGLDGERPVGLVGLQRLHGINSLYLYNKDRRIGG